MDGGEQDQYQFHGPTDPLLPVSEDGNPEDPLYIQESLSGEITLLRDNAEAFRKDLLKNVRRVLALSWFSFMGRAVWSQSVLSMYVYLLNPNKIERVGYITAIIGLSQVVSSIPSSQIAKTGGRRCLLRFASLVTVVAIGLTVYAVRVKVEFFWLLGALAAWGLMWGMTGVLLPQIFDGSVPEEDQMLYFTRGSRVIRSSNVLGPMLVGAIFFKLGNEWTLYNCSMAIYAGLLLCIPMAFLICSLRDPGSIDSGPPMEISVDDSRIKVDPESLNVPEGADVSTDENTALLNSLGETDRDSNEDTCLGCSCFRQTSIVPALIFASDVLSAVASGVSTRYFPVFFVGNLGLNPLQVQLLYTITPLGQAATKCISRHMARVFGASVVTVFFYWMFVLFLGAMVYLFQSGVPVWITCCLYLGHAFLMNSTTTLTESIRLSTLSDDQPMRWTMGESLQLLLWSSGAAAGGILVCEKGILLCFWATVALQLLASLPVFLLCCVGPSKDDVDAVLFPTENGSEGIFDPDTNEVFDGFPLDEPSLQTLYEDSRERLSDSESDSEFFDCASMSASERRPAHNTVAHYRQNTCIYDDGQPAYVPPGTSSRRLPLNYLKASHGNRKHALTAWKATQKWRREEEIWKIHTVPNPWYKAVKQAYPHHVHGRSKEGYPVIYEQVGKMQLKKLFNEGCEISDMTRWYTFLMEYLSNCLQGELGNSSGGDVEKSWGFVVVMDMNGTGLSMLSSKVLSYLAQAGHINTSHYPLSMKKCFLVNSGTLVASVWPGLRAVMPSTVHYELFGSTSGLENFIELDEIPSKYGGTSPYPLGQHPDELRLQELVASTEGR